MLRSPRDGDEREGGEEEEEKGEEDEEDCIRFRRLTSGDLGPYGDRFRRFWVGFQSPPGGSGDPREEGTWRRWGA